MLPIHVRIVDAETRQPLAARLRVTDSAGQACVPLGRPATFRTGSGEDVGGQVRLDEADWYYVDGGAELVVPTGQVHVEAWHGPEYRPLRETLEVKTGQLAIRLQMTRRSNERTRGWCSGDVSAFEIDPFAALLEGVAEDLAVVNVLARETDTPAGTRLPNLLAFSGAAPALDRSGCLVAVGTFNTHAVLGSLSLLGCHRPVYPLRFGGPVGRLDWSLIDWCDQAHRKTDGVVIWPDGDPAQKSGELIAATLARKIDAFEVRATTSAERWALWYDLLSAGVHLALVGGSGKDSNTMALGHMRTYAEIGALSEERPTYPAWLEAIRTGLTYATTGPLLSVLVGGRGPGRTVDAVVPGTPLSVRTEAWATVPFETMELVHDGKVISTHASQGGMLRGHIENEVRIERSGWIAARCRTAGQIVAHSTPVYVTTVEKKIAPTPADLLARLGETRSWAETAPGEDRFRQQLLANLDDAESRLNCVGGSR